MMKRPALVIVLAIVSGASLPAQVDFRREILPILSDHCFHCHGPDEASRKGRLRLDTKDGAYRERNGVAAVVPGKSGESEMIRRIHSADPDEVMPPPNANRKLSTRQKELLKQWIDGGAAWGKHWAFEPIALNSLSGPNAKPATIDGFLDESIARAGLTSTAPATKAAWLRRVTFDLTGLPPTIAELDAFEKDSSPQAFETVVDRLLASPRYGERMAADWLDVARFADTHGYQSDRDRPVWPYRDWVIRAFNRNQRYDEFVRDQLAGDLLPKATQEQKLATAFNRLHMQNEEGGIVEEEFRVAYVNDRVTTFGTAFLGLTFECARCHDHKYDPISQKDFYSFFAFFQNIDESGQTSYFTPATPVPALMLTTEEQEKKRADLTLAVQAAERNHHAANERARADFPAWKRPDRVTVTGLVAHYPFDLLEKNQSPNAVDPKQAARGHESPTLVNGWKGRAVSLDGENGFGFPGVGHFAKADPFTIAIAVKVEKWLPRQVILHHSRAPIDAGSRGYELLLEDGRIAVGLHHMWPGNSLKVRTIKPITVDRWTHLAVTSDGSGRAAGLTIIVDGTPQPVDVIRDGLEKDITYGGGEPDLTLGHRFRDNGFKHGAADELRVYNRRLSLLEVRTLLDDSRASDDDWFDYYRSAVHEPSRLAMAEVTKARQALNSFVNPITEIMTMREMPTPKPAFVLKRGNYDQPGEPVSLTTPAWLNPYPAKAARNRSGLVEWLLAEENPLFARVAVNRLWQQMFGTGLVETSDNFGTQGAGPTHPELLDWLAGEYRRTGWDTKAMLKRMALTKAYRRSSRATPESLAKDPTNVFLSRAPVRRLSAEMLRDQALVTGGLLVEKRGGPSVRPYQPDGLWELAMGRPRYDRSKGDDLYRRSLYTYVKRTAPHPQLQTFDAADRSNCSVRRQSTSTPLQSLALMNDPQYVEAARALAAQSSDLALLFRTVTSREPTAEEQGVLAKLDESQKRRFAAEPAAAERFLRVGDKVIKTSEPTTLAARAVVVLTLFNHDDAVQCR